MTRTLDTSGSNDDKDPSFEAGVTMTRTLVTSGCNDDKDPSFEAGVTMTRTLVTSEGLTTTAVSSVNRFGLAVRL